MLFSESPRTVYDHPPVHEVICQFRFPAILTINNREPADFQEAVREEFPQYSRRQETVPPRIVGSEGPNLKAEQQPPVINYYLVSADNLWKLNLTENFLALSTLRYTGWETFAHKLDKALAEFIRIYKPAYFERVGLRYINFFSRKALGEEHTPWAELISPAYTGPLREPDAREPNFITCSSELLFKADSSCLAKIHAGPGRIKNNAQEDPEVKFVFDMDLSMNGQTPCNLSAAALATLHGHATRIFEGALTDRLRDAMGRA
jgi:uncharacterized protein (TIGR04255 family)